MGVNSQNNHESVHALVSTPRHPPPKNQKNGDFTSSDVVAAGSGWTVDVQFFLW
jgi:hypothetical protein